MSKKIRGAKLLPISDLGFKKHNAEHAWLAKHDSGEREIDPRAYLCDAIENMVRFEVSKSLTETEYRVLRWQEDSIRYGHATKYKELDAIYESELAKFIILEVKATSSKSSIKGGVKQLKKSVQILQTVYKDAVGILVIADIGAHTRAFGRIPADFDIEQYKYLHAVDEVSWPIKDSIIYPSSLYIVFLPSDYLAKFLTDSPDMLAIINEINEIGLD